ncbi:hypothetical protein C8R47DRAFT_1165844 [Mycena vitilis]|nr:hypothetical protein C8R47DRAFT_1165844 [Mycena vitilis]
MRPPNSGQPSMPHKLRLLRNATWTLRNLCRGHPPRPQWDPILPAMTVLTKLVYSLDDKILRRLLGDLLFV